MLSPKKYGKHSLTPFKIYGFDVETTGKDNKFYMGSVYSDEGVKVFYDRINMRNYLMSSKMLRYRCLVVATNLMFDFFTLFDYEELEGFDFIFRGSELISVTKKVERNGKKRKISFVDTFHFGTKMSVKNLGRIINLPKLDTPLFLSSIPSTKPYLSTIHDRRTYSQVEYLELYNIRDSEITYRFTKFFQDKLISIGGVLKPTIASISLNYFRLKYLKGTYTTPSHQDNLFMFRGYYGGRTEVFKRGRIRELNYYDFNSLYPSVMLNKYPNPNSMMRVNKGLMYYIDNFEGVSDVLIDCPDSLRIPLLPLRVDNKLIFPVGEFRGVYTHLELRKALSLGYRIKEIGECIYFVDTIDIFKDFVMDNYNNRIRYKNENNPIEFVFKIILNSLYGKFGQRYDTKQNITFINDFDFSTENVMKYENVEVLKEFFVLSTEHCEKPPSFLQPIWSVYVTAYGRIKLYETFEKVGFDNVYYCDTDSVFVNYELETTDRIGDLKLEYRIKKGLLIKPKFYEINDKVKAKGLKGFDRHENLIGLMDKGFYESNKFYKFKETLRRVDNVKTNETTIIKKYVGFEDNKRNWNGLKFSKNELQESNPLKIKYEDGVNVLIF